jgi:hypothetical protein
MDAPTCAPPCYHPLGAALVDFIDDGNPDLLFPFSHLPCPLYDPFDPLDLEMPLDDESFQRWISAQLAAQSVPAKSPNQHQLLPTHSAASGSHYSLSPGNASNRIFTPESSTDLSPLMNLLDDPESDGASISPQSDDSTADDFILVGPHAGAELHGTSDEMDQPPRSSQRLAPPTMHTAQQTPESSTVSLPRNNRMGSSQWSAFDSSSVGMNNLIADPTFTSYASGEDLASLALFENESILSSAGDFHASTVQQSPDLPFRTFQDGSVQATYEQIPPQEQHSASHIRTSTGNSPVPPQVYQQYPGPSSTAVPPTLEQQYHSTFPNQVYGNSKLEVPAIQDSHVPVFDVGLSQRIPATNAPPIHATRASAASRPNHPQQPRVTVRSRPSNESNATFAHSSQAVQSQIERADLYDSTLNGLYPAIVKADPARISPDSHHSSQKGRVAKGGRPRGKHLHDEARKRSHFMRKVGACWRCAIQRDPCDDPGDGQCCSRCAMRAQKGQTYFFDCDRSKLPDFVHEFLPTQMHREYQKQYIENTVSREVVTWHSDNCIDIYLSTGYGPPLRWKVFEFTPKSPDLLIQLQYFQDPYTGRSVTKQKYSPPYGLLSIDSVDDRNFEAYLEDLLRPEHLKELGESCYAEENYVDEAQFQCKLLDHLCQLYMNTSDSSLRPLLADILRMVIITYIMGHTITIADDTLYPVINNIRHSQRPLTIEELTSPRLVNRQLKFFFHIIRNNIYEKILKWQQHTLHTAGSKEKTWLHSFCVMLGFAMVLEEIQRTIICQCEAKVARSEATLDDALAEASRLCDRIDARYQLLVGLFQCKYRDKKWGARGSFGCNTPEARDPFAASILGRLRELVEERAVHLRARERVRFSLENQCLYTSRLTAKFLLPFLNLPPS